jgi:hypothetical protein
MRILQALPRAYKSQSYWSSTLYTSRAHTHAGAHKDTEIQYPAFNMSPLLGRRYLGGLVAPEYCTVIGRSPMSLRTDGTLGSKVTPRLPLNK